MKMQEFKYGVEIETTGLDRAKTAEAVRSVVGGQIAHEGGAYDCYSVTDLSGRKWKIVHDASLIDAPMELRAEVVTPILLWNDIPQLQEVVRAIRRAGGRATNSCGIHYHVERAPFNAIQLANLIKIVYKQENLLIHAFGIRPDRLARFTRPTDPRVIENIERNKPRTMEALNRAWYGHYNPAPDHYDRSRYHILNLNPVFNGATWEVRAANGSLHAGKIKAGLILCLALAAKALNSRAASSQQRPYCEASAKYDFRVFLVSGLGMIGEEFKNVRMHLLENMPGDAAFKTPRRQTETATPTV
jgi:hypothetical protein